MNILTPQELEKVKTILVTLMNSLNQKDTIGSKNILSSDESIVLEALQHPERGDVEISVYKDKGDLDIFMSNRRNMDSPFSIMGYDQMKQHPERRPLDSYIEIKKEEYGLFLVSFQDRELLTDTKVQVEKFYSVHLGISQKQDETLIIDTDIKGKELEECSLEEKVRIYTESSVGDSRVEEVKKEFFLFDLPVKIYNRPADFKKIFLEPNKFRNKIGQIIRDCYPYRIRISLREDFVDDHETNLNECYKLINGIKNEVEKRIDSNNPAELKNHYNHINEYLLDILTNDPEFSRFV